jgi:hypothetical protein
MSFCAMIFELLPAPHFRVYKVYKAKEEITMLFPASGIFGLDCVLFGLFSITAVDRNRRRVGDRKRQMQGYHTMGFFLNKDICLSFNTSLIFL